MLSFWNYSINFNGNKWLLCCIYQSYAMLNLGSIDSSDNVVLQLVLAIKYVSHMFCNDASHIHQPCSKIEILDYSIALKESETVCSVTFPTAPNCVPLRRFTPIDSRLVSLVPVVAGSDRSAQGTILVPNVLRGSSMPRGQFLTQLLRDLCCHEDGHGTHGRGRMVLCINCISFNDYHLSTHSYTRARRFSTHCGFDCGWHVIKTIFMCGSLTIIDLNMLYDSRTHQVVKNREISLSQLLSNQIYTLPAATMMKININHFRAKILWLCRS